MISKDSVQDALTVLARVFNSGDIALPEISDAYLQTTKYDGHKRKLYLGGNDSVPVDVQNFLLGKAVAGHIYHTLNPQRIFELVDEGNARFHKLKKSSSGQVQWDLHEKLKLYVLFQLGNVVATAGGIVYVKEKGLCQYQLKLLLVQQAMLGIENERFPARAPLGVLDGVGFSEIPSCFSQLIRVSDEHEYKALCEKIGIESIVLQTLSQL